MITYRQFKELIRAHSPPVPQRPPTMGEEVAADWDRLVEATVAGDVGGIAAAEWALATGPIGDFVGTLFDVGDADEDMVSPEGVIPLAWEQAERIAQRRFGISTGRAGRLGRGGLRTMGGPIAMGGQMVMGAAYDGLSWADALASYLSGLVGYADTLARIADQVEDTPENQAAQMPYPIIPADMRREYAGRRLHLRAYERGQLPVHEVIAGADELRPPDRHPSREYFIQLRDEHRGGGLPELRRRRLRHSIIENLIGLDREALGLPAGFRPL
jgi:hypothetical protein